jgi:type VI secretion system secreted protein VgrG
VADSLFHLSGDKLPADAHAIAYEAHEGLSRRFSVTVDMWTSDAGFEPEQALRTPALLTIDHQESEPRYFHGIVVEIELMDAEEDKSGTRYRWRLTLGTFLDALFHREGSRIFQDLTPIHVVRKIFEGAGISEDHVQWLLYNDYKPREYIVQYRESELNFVERIFEDEGLFYFFRHSPEGHKLVVADDASAFAETQEGETVQLAVAQAAGASGLVTHVQDFTRTRSLRTTEVYLRDYDFKKPTVLPDSTQPAEDVVPVEYYEYPGGFVDANEAKRRALARMRALRADADVVRGKSRASGLRVGASFSVEGADQEYCNGEFVVSSLVSRGLQMSLRADSAENFANKNEFEGIPAGAAWAPPRKARRPRIRGIQTAIVTGTESDPETIHCDEYARIKVHFHWDRLGKYDDKATCWLRTTQLNTGGSVILPRLGWEVAVAFFDGDPDRPFVLGRLYNGNHPPPYALPGANASGAIKSMSSPGGAGHNEIKMSDTAGSQGFGISAQKDLNITIGHDKTEKVGVDETHQVTVNLKRSVGSNESTTVSGNQSITVGSNHSQKIGGSQSVTVGANETSNSTHDFVENAGSSETYTVGANFTSISNGFTLEAKSGMTRTVSAAHIITSPSAVMDNIGGSFTETVGAVKLVVAKGTVAESTAAAKTQTTAAAEVHLVSGKLQSAAKLVTEMIGGLHYQDVAGDYTVKAPMITLMGAVGAFRGGGSDFKLGGGPITIKGSKVALKGATIIKMGASLKLGSG